MARPKVNTEFRFCIEPVAVNEGGVRDSIKDIAKRHFPDLGKLDLTGIPTKRYTTAKGSKITALIKKRLKKANVSRKQIDDVWSLFCKEVRNLYGAEQEILAAFRSTDIAGNGTYENGATCYRLGSNNSRSARLMGVWNRGRFLTIERIDGEWANEKYGYRGKGSSMRRPRGRVFYVHLGKRHIFMFNFYYASGLDHNPHLFIQALEHIYKTKFTKVVNNITFEPKKGLPFYKNGGYGTLITDAKGKEMDPFKGTHFILPASFKVKCPYCPVSLPWKEYYHQRDGATDFMGCCSTHAKLRPEKSKGCVDCGIELEPANYHWSGKPGRPGSHGPFCEACYYRLTPCPCCGDRYPEYTLIRTADGDAICNACASKKRKTGYSCIMCGGVYMNERKWPKLIAGHRICSSCKPHLPKCGNCDEPNLEILRDAKAGRYPAMAIQSLRMVMKWDGVYCQKCIASTLPIRRFITPNVDTSLSDLMKDYPGSFMATESGSSRLAPVRVFAEKNITEMFILALEALVDEQVLQEGVI